MEDELEPLPQTGIWAPNGKSFPWGPITKIHEVGQYQIAEYREDRSQYSNGRAPGREGHGRTMFHAYINGNDTSRSYYTLSSCLVGAVAYNRCGPNSQAAAHFDLMTLGKIPGYPE